MEKHTTKQTSGSCETEERTSGTPGEALVFTYSIVVFPVSLSSYLLAFQAGHELGEMMMAAL